MSQKKRIREHLEKGHPISPFMALKHFRCMRLAARVNELRNEGLDIHTEFVSSGKGDRYAVYRMGA